MNELAYFFTGAWTIVNLALLGLIIFAFVLLVRYLWRANKRRS